jgi:hypothetical protein
MDRDILAALQFDAIKLKRDLGVVFRVSAWLDLRYATNQFRSLGDLGAIERLYVGLGLDHYAVAGLGRPGIQLVHQLTIHGAQLDCRYWRGCRRGLG